MGILTTKRQPKLVRFLTFTLTLCSTLPLAPPLAAQDCLPEMAGSQARIVDVQAVATDLLVTIAWDEMMPIDPISLSVLDPAGAVMATAVATPLPGDMTIETVVAALATVKAHGLAYTITLSAGLTDPYDFQVSIDCSGGPLLCSYRATGEFATDAVVVETKLAAELAAAAPTSTNILADIAAARPDLIGQIASLALQLDRLDASVGIPSGPSSCASLWTTTLERTRDKPFIDRQFEPAPILNEVVENVSCQAHGPGHYALAQKLDGGVTHMPRGETSLSLHLRSWDFLGWDDLELGTPGSAVSFQVRAPRLAPCEGRCLGTVQHDACFEGHLAVAAREVAPSLSQPKAILADAYASELAHYRVGEQEGFTAFIEAEATAAPGALETTTQSVTEGSSIPAKSPSTATLGASGLTTANVQGDPSVTSCALAELANRFSMAATAKASCAVQPVTEASTRSIDLRGYFAGNGGFTKTGGLTKRSWCP
ncbi:MAG: hypothetical protein AAF657_32200 [Acidobacteriota bacterium]